MSSHFSFQFPTKIEFGSGKIKYLGSILKEYGYHKVMIVTDPGLCQTPIIDQAQEYIQKAGLQSVIFHDVLPNPHSEDCEKGALIAQKEKVDAVVAIGGGSSMDTAKAISALTANPGSIHTLFYPNTVPQKGLPIICVPTTAGTGSEVTMFAVISVTEKQSKESILDTNIAPILAINDPDLLKSVPPSLAAATGMDALTHAIEAYTCKVSSPLTDALALHAISLISGSLRDLVYQKTAAACHDIMLGSLLAGIAFGYSDVAGVHCLAESLGGIYNTPHGVANSIFLPIVFQFNIPADVKKHSQVAKALGIDIAQKSDRESAQAAVIYLKTLANDIGIPTLRELGYHLTEQDCIKIAQKSVKNVSAPSNPRLLTEESLLLLIQEALKQ